MSGCDEAVCDELARRGAAGDREAIHALVGNLYDSWVISVRSGWRLRYSTDPEDDARDIALRIFEKVGTPSTLQTYVDWSERHPRMQFRDWMNIVVANETRTFLRLSRNALRNLIHLNTSDSQPSIRPPFTDGYLAKQLAGLVGGAGLLTERQGTALSLWLEGGSFDEVRGELGCSEAEARGLVRAAVARLRRKFGNVGTVK